MASFSDYFVLSAILRIHFLTCLLLNLIWTILYDLFSSTTVFERAQVRCGK